MANGNGNGNGNAAAVLFKVFQILVPLFTTLTLFGVGYGLTQINEARTEVAHMGQRLAGLESTLAVRVEKANAEHVTYDARIERLERIVLERGRSK